MIRHLSFAHNSKIQLLFGRHKPCFLEKTFYHNYTSSANKVRNNKHRKEAYTTSSINNIEKDKHGKVYPLWNLDVNEQQVLQRPRDSFTLQVLGTGNVLSPRALLLNNGDNRYLFNCGEETYRVLKEREVDLNCIELICVTSSSQLSRGGLRTIYRGADRQSMLLASPFIFDDLLAAEDDDNAFRFIEMQGAYRNLGVKIDPVLMQSSDPSEKDIMAFYCKAPPILSWDVEKLLKNYENNNEGNIGFVRYFVEQQRKSITDDRSECLDNTISFPPFMIVECPTKNFVSTISTETSLSHSLKFVVHFTPKGVFDSQEYRQWIKSLGSDVTHLVLNEECDGDSLYSLYSQSKELNRIVPRLYPKLACQSPNAGAVRLNKENNIIYGKPGLIIKLKELLKDKLDLEKACEWKHCNVEDREKHESKITEKIQTTEQTTKTNVKDLTQGKEFPQIDFLGTGCNRFLPTRNCAGILLHSGPQKHMLLDCGEGTLNQLYRRFGQNDKIFFNLSAIFLSHFHADHILGLVSVLQERTRVLKANFLPVTPLPLLMSAEGMPCIDQQVRDGLITSDMYRIYQNEDYHVRKNETDADFREESELLEQLGVKKIITKSVLHPSYAFGIRLTLNDNFQVAYGGDSKMCKGLNELKQRVWFGKRFHCRLTVLFSLFSTKCKGLNELVSDVNLAILEATYLPDSYVLAQKNSHSTVDEAIAVCQVTGAKRFILTHLGESSSPNPNLNLLPNLRLGTYAYDFMHVEPSQIKNFRGHNFAIRKFSYQKLKSKTNDLKTEVAVTKRKSGDRKKDAIYFHIECKLASIGIELKE